MISRLRGTALTVKAPIAVIDVQGVGYKVMCSQAALDTLTVGRACDLHTHMIVREDDISLYGFSSEDEIELFLMLLGVQGVGARTSIAILSKLITRNVHNRDRQPANRDALTRARDWQKDR